MPGVLIRAPDAVARNARRAFAPPQRLRYADIFQPWPIQLLRHRQWQRATKDHNRIADTGSLHWLCRTTGKQFPSSFTSLQKHRSQGKRSASVRCAPLIFQVKNDVAERVIQSTQRFRVTRLDCLSAPAEQIADFFGVLLAHTLL